MKRLILALAIALATFGAGAQNQNDAFIPIGKDPEWCETGLFASAHLGAASHKGSGSDLGCGLGVGFRWYIVGGLAWEVARVNYILSSDHFRESSSFQFSSAFRFDTPRFKFLDYRPLFFSIALGYNVSTTSSNYNGLDNEFVLGLKITPKFSLAFFYLRNLYINNWDATNIYKPGYYYDDSDTWGMAGIKVEILLK